jgi:hypothetical protein
MWNINRANNEKWNEKATVINTPTKKETTAFTRRGKEIN